MQRKKPCLTKNGKCSHVIIAIPLTYVLNNLDKLKEKFN